MIKKYFYDYDDYEDGGKNAQTLGEEILNDPDLPSLKGIVIGCWGEVYDNSCQVILDMLSRDESVAHIESLFVGDMSSEECEVSWIVQGNYDEVLKSLKNLKSLTVKGSEKLSLGELNHPNLETLEIICGGLPALVISEIANSNLPKLRKLNLYFGVEDYGFDGDIEEIKKLLKNSNVKNVEYLGLGNSGIQDDIVECVFNEFVFPKLKVLDFSNGTLSDKGAEIIINNIDKIKNIELLDLHYNYISDEYVKKLKNLGIKVDISEQMENDNEYGNYPMLTE